MNWSKIGRWIEGYFNYIAVLLAPVVLFYLIAVVPGYYFSDSNDDCCETCGVSCEDTIFERIIPSDLFLFVGLFTYPGYMSVYFLTRGVYRRRIDEIDEVTRRMSSKLDEIGEVIGKQEQETENK